MFRYLVLTAVVLLCVTPTTLDADDSLTEQFRQKCQGLEKQLKSNGVPLRQNFQTVCVSALERIARVNPTSKKVCDDACMSYCQTFLTVVQLKPDEIDGFMEPCLSSCKREAYKKIPGK